MNTLFFDTETTGLANEKLDPTHPAQPMPVQIGVKLDDGQRIERAAMNLLIQPEGWEVHPKAAEKTGITTEIADRFGINLITGIEAFLDLLHLADVVVAHNIPFDMTVMRRASFVYAEKTEQEWFDPFHDGKVYICTMRASTPILKLPSKFRGQDFKWPRLEECVKHYFDDTIEGAHDALVDVRATARVYYHLLDQGVFAAKAAA